MELGVFSNLSGPEWAAWVQAVGSVAAIWAATWMANRQIRAHERLAWETERRATRQFYDALHAVVDGAARQFLKLEPVMREEDLDDFGNLELLFHYEEQSFTDALNALETVRLLDLRSYELAEAIAGMKTGMVKLQRAVREANSTTRNREEVPDHQIRGYGDTTISQLKRHYHKAVEILGGQPILTHTWQDD